MAVSEDLGPRRIPPVAGLNLGPAGCAGRIAGPGGQALQPGETLFAEGDEADSAYEVACGLLRLCRMLPDGRRQIIGFLSEGGILGQRGVAVMTICLGGRVSWWTTALRCSKRKAMWQ